MDYYTAMEDAMVQAREDSFLPTNLTRDQMLTVIADIGDRLRQSRVRSDERIILHAQRHEFRLRLKRAEQVAQRLLGGSDVK
jgi:hypothetical protein